MGTPTRVVVTGGAGFIGGHLVERLLAEARRVVVVDNLVTGRRGNLSDDDKLTFVEADISEADWLRHPALAVPVDRIYHLACPPSPVDFVRLPVEICRTCALGTLHAVELALEKGARLLDASTSEVYGDPLVHPQPEDYRGNVSVDGPRSCYDEGKRFGEALIAAHRRARGLDARVVRIFNTYGPRMRAGDGRVVPAFITQALAGEPLTVHGDGSQTRSFCYVDDLVSGIIAAMETDATGPFNLGNPDERTILELAQAIIELTGSSSALTYTALPKDDPRRRRPDITAARRELDWEPKVDLRDGLEQTIAWFRDQG
ncbi:MAG: NAD-dependent epimerase/dehydratase family protein [Candidatus Coatesbacteria bacterium]|nr:NAD-dependent epimerase/dehydratase family protein [Candidatus Coatesbacteria bacterium]